MEPYVRLRFAILSEVSHELRIVEASFLRSSYQGPFEPRTVKLPSFAILSKFSHKLRIVEASLFIPVLQVLFQVQSGSRKNARFCFVFLFPLFTVGTEYSTRYFLIKHPMLRSENFLLEIFRDCCLLFNFQGSVLFCVVSSTQLDYNIICDSGCQYFFCNFF